MEENLVGQKTVKLVPEPESIVELLRRMFANGGKYMALRILGEGWPTIRIPIGIQLLEGKIELEEAVRESQKTPQN